MSTAAVFACYSAACRPPISGGTGGSLARVRQGTALMWRFESMSSRITAAAGYQLGMSGWGGDDEPKEVQGYARELLNAVNNAPLSKRVLYSGHVLHESLELGEEVEWPLVATSNSKNTASGYATGTISRSMRPSPLSPELRKDWEALTPVQRDAWGPGNVPHGMTVGGTSTIRSVRAVFKIMSSKSVPVSDWERVTSGKFRVRSVSKEPIKDAWVYDFDLHNFRLLEQEVYEIEYVGPAGS